MPAPLLPNLQPPFNPRRQQTPPALVCVKCQGAGHDGAYCNKPESVGFKPYFDCRLCGQKSHRQQIPERWTIRTGKPVSPQVMSSPLRTQNNMELRKIETLVKRIEVADTEMSTEVLVTVMSVVLSFKDSDLNIP